MERKELIKFINETISNSEYDFLGMSAIHEQEDNYKLFNDYDFQRQFLYDLFFDKEKISLDTSEATIKKESSGDLTSGTFDIEYSTTVTYEYNEKTYSFELLFHGENIDYKIQTSEHDGTKKIYIDWQSIDYDIYSLVGDLIKLHIFDKIKDERIERNFIKNFIGIFIEKEILD